MPSQVTITAMKTGPASALTKVFTNVTKLTYDFLGKTAKIESLDNPAIDIDIDGAATITHTISAKNHTVAVS